MMAKSLVLGLLVVSATFTACGKRARQVVVAPSSQEINLPQATPHPVLPATCTTSFTPVLQLSGTVGPVAIGVPQNFVISILGGCAGSLYRISSASLAFTSSVTFSKTFDAPGDKSVSEQVSRVDSLGGVLETSTAGPITVSVALPPTPTPTPGPTPMPLSCQFARLNAFSNSSTNLSFEMRTTGSVVTASVVQDLSIPVAPLSTSALIYQTAPIAGKVSLTGTVRDALGNPATCSIEVVVPGCTIAASNIGVTSADLTVSLAGDVAELKIDDVVTPFSGSGPTTKNITFAANGGERSSVAVVTGPAPAYDAWSCSTAPFTPPTVRSTRDDEVPPGVMVLRNGTTYFNRIQEPYRYVFAVEEGGHVYYTSVHLDEASQSWKGWTKVPYQLAGYYTNSSVYWANGGIEAVISGPEVSNDKYGMETTLSGGNATFRSCSIPIFPFVSWCAH